MRKTGIMIIILLFITSGVLAVLYQINVRQIADPPAGEEITIPPKLPATGREQEGLELSFMLDNRLDKEIILMIPANDFQGFCSVSTNGSLHFFLEELNNLEERKIHAWPEIMYIWNNGQEKSVYISIKKEASLPPFIILQAGFAAETVQFDDHGFSVRSFQLEPGTRFPLGLGLDLRGHMPPQQSASWEFMIIVN